MHVLHEKVKMYRSEFAYLMSNPQSLPLCSAAHTETTPPVVVLGNEEPVPVPQLRTS